MTVQVLKNKEVLKYKQWIFPGGEVGVQLLEDIQPEEHIEIRLTGIPQSMDIMEVAHLVDAIYRLKGTYSRTELYMPYIPYARQDRVCHSGESFGLVVFLSILGSFVAYLEKVIVVDPHSEVFPHYSRALYTDLTVIHQSEAMEKTGVYPSDYDFVIAPDAGAAKKTKQFGTMHDNLVTLSKTRTAEGILYDDFTERELSGKVLVVDDIGDGMGTFIALADMLKKNQPKITQLDVYVTHGIFSKGLNLLKGRYDNVYTYNLMNENMQGHSLLASHKK